MSSCVLSSDMSDASLRYLNSEQALADLAAFRNAMTKKFNLTSSKWISFGGSYPGSLSAWFRLKYPHLVNGLYQVISPFIPKSVKLKNSRESIISSAVLLGSKEKKTLNSRKALQKFCHFSCE